MMAFRGISKRFHLILSPSNPSYAASQFFFSRGFSSKLFVKAKIIRDKASNRSKGFGYVTFATEDEARKALMEMNGKLVDGRPVFVDNA
uniref:RRM domain-containing protein n=1 Tax=Manihot esculenta TaxID=3983 RepID=A0A2C9V3H8_MANES